jgi:hypothetical protein
MVRGSLAPWVKEYQPWVKEYHRKWNGRPTKSRGDLESKFVVDPSSGRIAISQRLLRAVF